MGAGGARSTDPARPRLSLAVLTCIDARLDPLTALRLRPGDAHVLRNAGGVVTEDVLRALAISQRVMGTYRIALVQHSDCRELNTVAVDEALARDTGRRPGWATPAHADPVVTLRTSARLLRDSPFLAADSDIRGFYYDLADTRLREVPLDV